MTLRFFVAIHKILSFRTGAFCPEESAVAGAAAGHVEGVWFRKKDSRFLASLGMTKKADSSLRSE